MKIYNKTLKKALRHLRAGQYSKVIALLEPKVPLFIENFHFYYFLGTACYYSGDMGGAETYLKRAIQVNRKAEEPRLFLAAVYLKKKDTTEAVRIWLGLLDLQPSCKKAKKGLNTIRKISDQDVLNSFLDTGRFRAMLPRTKKMVPSWFLLFLLLLGLLTGLYISSSLWIPALDRFKPPQRENLALLYKEVEKEDLLREDSPDALYILSDDEIKQTLKRAQSLFDQYKDNAARLEINKLKYSNAGEQVKQRALLLEGYLKDPDITSLSTDFSYKQVIQDPYLYENCLVLWKGRISNFRYVNDRIEFDFLVGYEESQVLEGIVPVILEFPVKLEPALPLELLARIQVTNASSIRLQAVTIHNMIE